MGIIGRRRDAKIRHRTECEGRGKSGWLGEVVEGLDGLAPADT